MYNMALFLFAVLLLTHSAHGSAALRDDVGDNGGADQTPAMVRDVAEERDSNGSNRPINLPLISDDCEETKLNLKIPYEGYETKDMEYVNKDKTPNKTVVILKDDSLLMHLPGISHMHSNDKERRAIPDNKTEIHEESKNSSMAGSNDELRSEAGDEKTSAWSGRHRDSKIRFSQAAPGERYLTPTMGLTDGPFIFRFLSGFFAFLHPFSFPTELLRDVIWNTVSVPQLILQSVRVEVGFIMVIVVSLMASLVVPAYGFSVSVLMIMGKRKSGDDSGSPTPGLIEDDDFGAACERRILLLLMQIFLLLSTFGVGVMVLGNEFANDGAAAAGSSLRAVNRDLSAYLHTTHRDLVHALLDSADQTIAVVDHDLDRVDTLLGEPIQKAIAIETGIDVALDSLSDITAASGKMSEKVATLGGEGSKAATLAADARDRLRELRRQLDVARDNCAKADRPLCDTIDTNGLDLIIRFEMISDQRLEPLMGALSAKNLSAATEIGRQRYTEVPKAIANQTKRYIDDVREALIEKRAEIAKAERSLSKAVRHLAVKIQTMTRSIADMIRSVDAVEFWRWFLYLSAVVIICIVILLLVIAVACGCCGAENLGGSLLKTSVILMCFLVVPMWCLAIITFAVGGHGEVFLCRPLYDEPEFRVLGKLLDYPGLLYKEKSGFFKELFRDVDGINIDQSIRNILNECKQNKAAYPVFQMNRILDINTETAYFNWSRLDKAKQNLKKRTYHLNFATPDIQVALGDIMSRTSINFTEYRIQLNGPITGKDLTSLADQLESIANQNSDLSTSSRIETLASRTRRIVVNNIQPLEKLRTDLVYKLTELELQVQPFQRQMNQSLSHLKTIQYYVDNQGGVIAEQKVQDYIKRITGYFEQYRGHVLDQIEKHVGPCRPVWDVFDSARALVCRHYVDSLNGFWLGLFGVLFMWIVMAPLSLQLRRSFKIASERRSGLLSRTISHQEPPRDNWR